MTGVLIVISSSTSSLPVMININTWFILLQISQYTDTILFSYLIIKKWTVMYGPNKLVYAGDYWAGGKISRRDSPIQWNVIWTLSSTVCDENRVLLQGTEAHILSLWSDVAVYLHSLVKH